MIVNDIKKTVEQFDNGCEQLKKLAFVANPPAQGPAMAPPTDPAAMQQPMPAAPNAMPPSNPADPAAMQQPMPADPNAGASGMPPELEQVLSQLGSGMQTVSQTVEQQQAIVEQMAKQQMELSGELQELKASLQGPAPFEASTKSPQDISEQQKMSPGI